MNKFVNLFGSFNDCMYKTITNLQIRESKIDVKDVFKMMIASSFNNNNYSNFTERFRLDTASPGNLSYWRVKIYDCDFSDLYKQCYDYYKTNKENIFNDLPIDRPVININNAANQRQYDIKINNLKHVFKRYNVKVGDGTVINCAVKNPNGKNVSSIIINSIYDIDTKLFSDYEMAYDTNERKALLRQELTKEDLIIIDRGYSSPEFLQKLDKTTNFVVRMKSNYVILKKFIKDHYNTMVTQIGDMKVKIIKYHIDKSTKNIILNKYIDDNNEDDEDKDSVYILMTNVVSLTRDDCINLYDLRWSIEPSFKKMKTNFKLRHICKESNINDPVKKTNFWINMSFLMYNMTAILKSELDRQFVGNCRFSKCAAFIREFIVQSNKTMTDKLIKKLVAIGKRFQNNTKNNKNLNSDRPKKRGRYEAINTIQNRNEGILDENELEMNEIIVK